MFSFFLIRFKKILIIILLALSIPLSHSSQIVNVGGYIFPPFVFVEYGQYKGLTLDLIKALNQYQEEFKFQFVPISSKGRYSSFESNKFDLIFFEDKKWGWDGYPVVSSRVILTGGEKYIALSVPGRDRSYFDDFSDKRISVVRGYHYGFANFNADEVFLKTKFNAHIVNSPKSLIRLILLGRDDIAVVTESYLELYFQENPMDKDKIIVSDKYDQIYQHTILLRKGSALSLNELNDLLNGMKQFGILNEIFSSYNQPKP
ncbi:substrate-binding periplasmic protein [Dongshaea marina]|uniref:substrate-binding periplasmic protein n=1 Tax=Dongshaea marina TaxID=2047966 RepID=UPI00131F2156|nr:transporter substrate-binding domain-containing protein [Dongshaea marina]